MTSSVEVTTGPLTEVVYWPILEYALPIQEQMEKEM